MDPQLLNHLLQLAAKTGDRLIVVDPASQRPFVLMGIAQYEALLPHADLHADPERGSQIVESSVGVPMVAPGLDAVAQRANAELATWRAQQPVSVIEAPTTIGGFSQHQVSRETGAGFSPEPLQPVPPDEDRFYVEPLE